MDILKKLKEFGAVKVAKRIVAEAVPGEPIEIADDRILTEADFTEIVKDYALGQRRADETPEQAFARVYSEASPDGLTIRKAMHAVKSFPNVMVTEPMQVGGAAATAVDDPEDALAQLTKLAAEQRTKAPWMTAEQAFAHVYSASENAALAAAERSQNRPRARVYQGA